MEGIVFDAQKRRFLSLKEASVPITDIAFQRGAGVFEALLAHNGRPFHLKDYLKRLQLSARLLGIKEHFLPAYLSEKIHLGVKKINSPVVSIRIIVTGGDSHYLSFEGSPRLYIIFRPFFRDSLYPKLFYQKGVSLSTTSMQRTLPTVKSHNCLSAVVSYQIARRKKYFDSLYVSKDRILEGTTFNFAIIIKNNLITPEDNILEGVTIQVILKLAKKIGLNILRKPITMKELRRADEAFLSSSSREVMPVVKIDNFKIKNGEVGPISKKLLELYRREIER